MTANWKNAERLICRALGGERRGPTGKRASDCSDDVPWAVSVKHTNRAVPTPLGRWIEAAKIIGRLESKPWVVVVKKLGSPKATVTMDFVEFIRLAKAAETLGRDQRYSRLVGAMGLENALDPGQQANDVIDDLNRLRRKRKR